MPGGSFIESKKKMDKDKSTNPLEIKDAKYFRDNMR